MMKVKVLKTFRDKTANLVMRKAGDIYEAEQERADALVGLGYVEVVDMPDEKPHAEHKVETPKEEKPTVEQKEEVHTESPSDEGVSEMGLFGGQPESNEEAPRRGRRSKN